MQGPRRPLTSSPNGAGHIHTQPREPKKALTTWLQASAADSAVSQCTHSQHPEVSATSEQAAHLPSLDGGITHSHAHTSGVNSRWVSYVNNEHPVISSPRSPRIVVPMRLTTSPPRVSSAPEPPRSEPGQVCFASLASFTLGNVCGLIPVYTAVFGGNCMNSLNLKYTVTFGFAFGIPSALNIPTSQLPSLSFCSFSAHVLCALQDSPLLLAVTSPVFSHLP